MDSRIFENREQWTQDYESGWLKQYLETGETNWKIYVRPRNETLISGRAVDLSTSRLALITTAGSYLKDIQAPYDAENDLGDYTYRLYPSDTPFEALAFAHTHYDHTMVDEDPQVLIPLQHLRDKVSAGEIGELAPDVISLHGYQPDARHTVDETCADVLRLCKEMQVQAALLVPA